MMMIDMPLPWMMTMINLASVVVIALSPRLNSLQSKPELCCVSAVGEAPLTPLELVDTTTKPMDISDLEFPILEDQDLSAIVDTTKDATLV
eukprot:601310-Ditylum_brightwellii.AAC.1